MANTFSYRRPKLALDYCDALEGHALLDARSGLFLSAPRRTGKSTFLREDLLPAFTNRNWTIVYADLWANRAEDPGKLIAAAVKGALAKHEGVITQMAKATGLEKVNVFGALIMDFKSLSLPANVTLPDALAALQAAAKTPVAVVIDEAQHATTTPEGMNAMFALKAARDQMNQGGEGGQNLFLVFTGSNRDKLSQLVRKKDAPFYGCSVSKFPLLDRGFSDAFADFINTKLTTENQFSKEAIWEAFKLVGHRPEKLREIINEMVWDGGADQLEESLKQGAQSFQKNLWEEMESEFNALTLNQRAVLVRIIDAGANFEPFSEASMKAYEQYLSKRLSNSDVQGALAALREKNLIWQAAYGAYALEDESMAIWHKQVKPD